MLDDVLYHEIQSLLKESKKLVIQNVNATMVFTYFQIGKIIVEHEQEGAKRAKYNAQTLKTLSIHLIKEFGKGFSITNLERMRLFYLEYSKSATLSTFSFPLQKNQNIQSSQDKTAASVKNVMPQFTLSWSHYVFLMRMNDKEREFYEKESQINNWSLRELKRQFNSALFERIILSTDKQEILADNILKYHAPEKPEDLIKDPYILEFLGLKSEKNYSENQLELAIIDNLEHFLLEMGKGFAFIGRQQKFTFDERHFFVDQKKNYNCKFKIQSNFFCKTNNTFSHVISF